MVCGVRDDDTTDERKRTRYFARARAQDDRLY